MALPRHVRKQARKSLNAQVHQQRARRVLTASVTAVIVFSLLVARLRPETVSYAIGDVAAHTIKASRAATYVDKEETERLRAEAGKTVMDVYTRDPAAEARALQTVQDVFAVVEEVRRDVALRDAAARAEQLAQRLDIPLKSITVQTLVASPRGSLQRLAQSSARLTREAMSQPLRSNTDDVTRARETISQHTHELPFTPRYQQVVAEIVTAALQPNQIFDAAATETKREEVRKKVPSVLRQLQPGDVIVYKDETVTQRHLDMFTALGMIQPQVDYVQGLALLGVLLLLTLTLTLYIRLFAGDVHGDDRAYMVLCLTLIAAAALFSLTKGVGRFEVVSLSIATGAAIFLSLALRPVVAVGLALYLGALAALASPGNDVRLLLAATICATLAAYAVRPRESRGSTVARAAFATAIVNAATLAASSFVFGYTAQWDAVGYAALGGLLSAVAAAGMINILERPLGITTSLLLLELQNPNEPLLKRLLTEAPGSYQSSVMVANLAEPAAEAVGADPVLTRTACMYHDIGKLKRPYFFVENQFGGANPHSRLSPHLSALVIIAHVKDGAEMAREIKLPPAVASVILQHHGTSLASFMYQKARAEADEDEEVRESDFRYPGPKPQTRENAIIMLADTVEAAARAMTDTSPDKVAELVERLVNARIGDGQIDESPLTFADITTIKQSFVKTLNGMFHQRLGYPTDGARQEDGKPAPAMPPSVPNEPEAPRDDAG